MARQKRMSKDEVFSSKFAKGYDFAVTYIEYVGGEGYEQIKYFKTQAEANKEAKYLPSVTNKCLKSPEVFKRP